VLIKDTWRNEYNEYQYLETQVVVDETELEEAFKQHSQVSEWESQFSRIDKGESLSDWQSQFSTFNPEVTLDQTEEIAKQFEAMWRRDNPDFEGIEDTDYDLNDPKNWETEFMSGFPQGEYIFEPNNAYLNHADPLAEAKRLLQEGGTLQQASLAFEAALQKEHRESSEVWLALGELQAEIEKETAAIRALEQAISVDENNLQAYLVWLKFY
jgi:peroxin-5